MSDFSALLVEEGAGLCGRCHEEVVADAGAETGHPPASEDCLSCHVPHTSSKAGLLDVAPAELCVGCHDTADEDLTSAHLNADLTALGCLDCHDPHGSGQPSLLARIVHPPVLEGCDGCHEGSAGQLMENGESSLCLVCHDGIGETAGSAEVPHAALEVGRCVDCHNPHASRRDHLVKGAGAGSCVDCHEDQEARQDEVAHGVIGLIGCHACHEPHGGSLPKLLRKSTNDLCLSCHAPAGRPKAGGSEVLLLDRFPLPADRARSMATLRLSPDGTGDHPVKGHRALGRATEEELASSGTTFQGELECLTCHDPHKGRSKELLRGGAVSPMQLCLECHPK
jgi:predicted CXXCH cytochrome family protein